MDVAAPTRNRVQRPGQPFGGRRVETASGGPGRSSPQTPNTGNTGYAGNNRLFPYIRYIRCFPLTSYIRLSFICGVSGVGGFAVGEDLAIVRHLPAEGSRRRLGATQCDGDVSHVQRLAGVSQEVEDALALFAQFLAEQRPAGRRCIPAQGDL